MQRFDHAFQPVVHEDHVGLELRRVGAAGHRERDIRAPEDGRVVQAIAHHRDDFSVGLEARHVRVFVLRRHAARRVLDPERARKRGADLRAVAAREVHFETFGLQRGNEACGPRTQHVGKLERGQPALLRGEEDVRAIEVRRRRSAQRLAERLGTDAHAPPIDDRLDPPPGKWRGLRQEIGL